MKTAPRISIRNGRFIDPANGIDEQLDVHIQDGRVAALGSAPTGFQPELIISAADQVVCPGLIDLAVRLREPGQEFKATIASETTAAAASGITTLCYLPDTQSAIDTPAVAELIRQQAERTGKARVLPVGAMTRGFDGEYLSEMAALHAAGCVAVSNVAAPFKSTLIELHALEYAASFGLICILQPTDYALQDRGCVHEGYISARLGLPGIPEAAETVALARDLLLAGQMDVRVHFHALSTAAGAVLFGQSHDQNKALSADVAIHQLHLTEEHVDGFDSNCHVLPPLRTHADREALRQAVANGRIAAICSDHQPHEPDAKTNPFPATAPGISGLETLLPLTLKLVHEGAFSLCVALERLTWGPARCLGMSLGRLEEGAIADICIFDPEAPWQVDQTKFLSCGHNTPFNGWNLKGQVNWTLLAGRPTFQRYQ